MKILIITNSYLPQTGGLEIAVYNIAKYLTQAGHSIFVISGVDNLKIKQSNEEGIEILRIPFILPRIILRAGLNRTLKSILYSFLFPFFFPFIILKLITVYKNFKPDIVNMHYIGNNSFYTLILKYFFNFKLVTNIHGNDIEGVSDRSFISKLLTILILKKSDYIISNSKYMLNKAENIYKDINKKSCVIHNGIEPEKFINVSPYKHNKKYILSVANFVHIKGQDILLNAYYNIKNKYNGEIPDLIFAGDGPALNKCKKIAKELNISDNVIFLGKVEPEKIPSLLAGCEFFVHSPRKESFGIVILEAMASGKAIIATSAGGIPEIIKDGENGLLVQPEIIENLAEKVFYLLNNPDFTKKCEENNRDKISIYYWNLIIKKYIDIFTQYKI